MTPITVAESIIQWMVDNGYGTFDPTGTTGNIFLGLVPDDAPDNCWWVVAAGGSVSSNLVTAQNIKQYSTQIYCRNQSGQAVEEGLFQLETQINTRGCFTIDGFEIYSIESTMSQDNDRDAENRRTSSVVAAIQIYKSYVS